MKVIKSEIQLANPNLKNLKLSKDKLCVTTQDGHHIILKKNITHLVADSNYTCIYFNDQRIVCSQTIGLVITKINQPSFIRIHQSHVINLEYLKLVDSAFTTVHLINGIQLPISRSRKQSLRETIGRRFD